MSHWGSTLPLGEGVRMLSEDESGLVALYKPAACLSHPNRPGATRHALLNASYDMDSSVYHWTRADELGCMYLLNRLDSPTSGVILGAQTAGLASEVRAQFRDQLVSKVYYALVKGTPPKKEGEWKDCLIKKNESNKRVRVKSGNGATAVTRFRLLESKGPFSLLALFPKTGRTHQLRVQCAMHHLPIVGDKSYGDFKFNAAIRRQYREKRLFLHAHAIELKFDWQGRSVVFQVQSEMPQVFKRMLE